MTLYGIKFFGFLAVTLAVTGVLQRIIKDRQDFRRVYTILLSLISYVFIAMIDYRFCSTVLVVTLIAYVSAMLISLADSKRRKKIYAAFGIVIPLGMLGVYKYYNFFIETIKNIFGANGFGALDLIVPAGISFFTFTAVSYVIDVYRGKTEANKNFFEVVLYISFFPKLISGPIVRSTEMFPQIKNIRGISLDNISKGGQILLFGIIKKCVFADNIGVFVNDVFSHPYAFGSLSVIFAVVSYALQIYLDFSGYSDMAIGVAKCYGFDFGRNFNMPYISRNITEFWKRWHISFSSWLQDYLYIPLGGNRKGKFRQYLNLLITMLIGGLWHGANTTFIIWGALNGAGLIVHKLFMQLRVGKRSRCGKFGYMISAIITFVFVNITWIFFRAESYSNAMDVLKQCTAFAPGINQPFAWSIAAVLAVAIATAAGVIRSRKNIEYDKKGNATINGFYPIVNLKSFWGLVILFTAIGLAIILSYQGESPFIYGNF